MRAGVDFYYTNGFLINFYAHSLTAALAGTPGDEGQAADLMSNYVAYCADSSLHPRIWPANARNIYQWWSNRSTAQSHRKCWHDQWSTPWRPSPSRGRRTQTRLSRLYVAGFGAAVPLPSPHKRRCHQHEQLPG